MTHFWRFAASILHYRRLLILALLASLLDAMCAFGGFASLMWVIDQLFKQDVTVQQLMLDKLDTAIIRPYAESLRPIILEYVPADEFGGFVFIMVVILGFSLVGAIMRYLHQYFAVTALLRAMMRIRQRVFRRLLLLPTELCSRRGASQMISRLSGDVGNISQGMRLLLGKSVRNVFMGTALLILAILINWKLTGLFLLGTPAMAYLIRRFGKRMRRITHRTLQQNAQLLRVLQESLQHSDTVKLHQAEGYERRRFHRVLQELLTQQMRAMKIRAISSPVVEFIAVVAITGVALVAGWYIFQHDADATELLKVMAALSVSASSFKPLANLNNQLQTAAAGAERVQELLDFPVEPEGRNLPRLPRHHESIEFRNVTYAYPEQETPAVSDVSLHVDYGMAVAIVGPNGSGKTTLMSLLPRLMIPQQGHVFVDGMDIGKVRLRSLRRQIAVVSQQPTTFQGTIAANIAYGWTGAERERIIAAAKSAYADEFISTLPDGYDSMLTEGGRGLSGGQRQRLCIARAILRDPAILILDEATSQIDADSEAKISAALTQLRHGRTTFIIAHRLSTVVNADLIVVMDAGQIVATGKHSELLESSPLYRALSRTQLLSGEPTP